VSGPTILDTIVAQRRKDVALDRAATPLAELEAQLATARPALDFVARLRREAPMAVIAEVKRASPSKGDIAPGIDAAEQAAKYARAGAAGISILTEPTWFKGDIDDLCRSREAIEPMGDERPGLLRKDFLVDRYQVVEARVAGADSVLLIVATLDDKTLRELMAASRDLGMEPLVEVNNAAEMERALCAGARLIGVNNRDLRDFSVDLGTTDRLAGMVKDGVLLAALSGIGSRADVERFQSVGAAAVLVGEALMRAPDPAELVRELRGVS
jgi:anthranilate synthase/indole-3-glycerol phosphate synthase/phosphoribosylanthranilate isomerase